MLVIIITIPNGLFEIAKSEKIITHENFDFNDNSYIDTDIILTKKHLHILTQAANQIQDLKIKEFIQKIINIINNQDKVDYNDIKSVINNLNLNTKIKGIHFLCILNSDGFGYCYNYGIYPFIFDYILYDIINLITFFGPSMYAEWKSPNAVTKINGRNIYDEPHNGHVIGFFGLSYYDGTWPVVYKILGFSTLVIITDYDYS